MKQRDVLAVFNRGIISRLAIARTDVSRVALSAEQQTNWMPRTLGSMMLRPGLQYHGANAGDGAYIPFVFSTDDKAIIELSGGALRVWDDGDELVTRASVSATISNSGFASSVASWTDADDSGAASTWLTGGFLQLLGTGTASARRRQEVTVTEQNTAHGLRITIERGPVILRVGSTAGDDDIFRQAVLRTGVHSIAFTPGSSSFFIEFSSYLNYPVLVDSCAMEAAGTMSLPTIWSSAATCKLVRAEQSGDVIFCGCTGLRPQRIERRPNNSWSVVDFAPEDGPFLTENVTSNTVTPSAISGSITLTASQKIFQEDHVGALWQITSQGQLVEADITAEATYSDPIRVTGVGDDRKFTITRAGTWNATATLQRSVGSPGSWVDVQTYGSNGSTVYDDGLDNSIAYYRIGVNAGDFSSGTAELSLEFSSGSIVGTVRITAYSSATQVSAVVLSNLGGTDATPIWSEGAWSDAQDWPEAVTVWEGRTWWSGKGQNWASISDAFDQFDPNYEGDAGPINRLVGDGAAQRTNWLLPLQRLIVGTDSAEHSVRSNSFDEPVTPTNYNTKPVSTKGSTQCPSATVDGRGYFIARDRLNVYELDYDAAIYGFRANRTTILCPEIGGTGFVRIAAQQSPDVRIHCIKADGTASVLVRDAAEDIMCWVDIETDGEIEDVVVLPGETEDRVFYRVKRDIGPEPVRYHEEWAREDQARGGAACRLADSFVTHADVVYTTLGENTTITELDHLEGESVVVWADGADMGTYTVSGGEIEISGIISSFVVGLGYTATYKSAKLAGQTPLGLSLTQRSRVNSIGLVLADTYSQGLEYGPDFTVMDNMPLTEDGGDVTETVWEAYDEDMITFPGEWGTDNRICLRATAPKPCTVLAAVFNIDREDSD